MDDTPRVPLAVVVRVRVAVPVPVAVLVRVPLPVPVPVPLNDRRARVRVAVAVGVRVAVRVRVSVPVGVSEIARERVGDAVGDGATARERVEVALKLKELVANTPKTPHKKARILIILTIEISLTHYKNQQISECFCPTTQFTKLFTRLFKLFWTVGYFLKSALGQKNTEICRF